MTKNSSTSVSELTLFSREVCTGGVSLRASFSTSFSIASGENSLCHPR
jgi:hypothetical protein